MAGSPSACNTLPLPALSIYEYSFAGFAREDVVLATDESNRMVDTSLLSGKKHSVLRYIRPNGWNGHDEVNRGGLHDLRAVCAFEMVDREHIDFSKDIRHTINWTTICFSELIEY